MNTILMIIVTFFAGMGAGLGTGFAGMSAAAVIHIWQSELHFHQMYLQAQYLPIHMERIRIWM